MKSKSVFKSVCVFVGLGFLLTIVWLIIFSMTITPDDAEMTVEPFSGASVTFGFACALIANFIYQYNSAKSLEQRIYSNTSSLESIKIRNRDLVDKANRLIDKHQKNEKESYIDIAKASSIKKEERHEKNTKDRLKTYSDEDVLVTSSQEFGKFINDFPELSNNQNVKILLEFGEEIKEILERNPYPEEDMLEILDRAFISKNLSPGGSAGLVAFTYFLYFLKEQ